MSQLAHNGRSRSGGRWSVGLMALSVLSVLSVLAINGAHAADVSSSAAATGGSAAGSVFTMLLGLGTVLALLVGLAWLFKRTGLVKGASGNAVAKIIGGVSVGTRERVMVIEVAEQWIVVGVALHPFRTSGKFLRLAETDNRQA